MAVLLGLSPLDLSPYTPGILWGRRGFRIAFELLHWLRTVDPARHSEIVGCLNWGVLGERTLEMWERPSRELRLLLYSLAIEPEGGPVRDWIAARADHIREIDPILASVSPEAAVAVARRGGRINLGGHNKVDWSLQGWAIGRVAEVANDVAVATLIADQARIGEHLAKLEGDCNEFLHFLQVINELNPTILQSIFTGVNIAVAAEHWPKQSKNRYKKARSMIRKILSFIRDHSTGDLHTLAGQLSPAPKPLAPGAPSPESC